MDWKKLWEAIKEPLRYIALSIVPFLIAYFAAINYWWAILATLILRGIDSYLHELAPKGKSGGLTRF